MAGASGSRAPVAMAMMADVGVVTVPIYGSGGEDKRDTKQRKGYKLFGEDGVRARVRVGEIQDVRCSRCKGQGALSVLRLGLC